jgi:hypothetical protein
MQRYNYSDLPNTARRTPALQRAVMPTLSTHWMLHQCTSAAVQLNTPLQL